MKVTLIRRPNVNIDNFDFLTEVLLQEESRIEQLNKQIADAEYELDNTHKNDAQNRQRLINKIEKLKKQLRKAEAEKNAAKKQSQTKGSALVSYNEGRTLVPYNGDDVPGSYNGGSALVQANAKKIQATVNKLGGISGMFQWLLDQIAKIPGWMQSIGESLKRLWGKVKEWMTRFHIINRAKSLSMVAIACIKFVAFMVARWIYRIIFKNRNNYNNAKYNDRILQQKSTINAYWKQFKNPTAETAVFIEALGEILREDNNGGMLMAMIQRAFRSKNGKKEADIARKACLKSSNSNLRKIGFFLDDTLVGTFAENTIPRRLKRRLYNETAFEFDDSLASFYESIILEAQAHKLKSIKKKAKKKVAIKQAKAKRSLRGRI